MARQPTAIPPEADHSQQLDACVALVDEERTSAVSIACIDGSRRHTSAKHARLNGTVGILGGAHTGTCNRHVYRVQSHGVPDRCGCVCAPSSNRDNCANLRRHCAEPWKAALRGEVSAAPGF